MGFKNIYNKIKNKISDGSIDSEHYLAYCYCFAIFVPLFVSLMGMLGLKYSSSAIIKFPIYLTFFTLMAVISWIFGKKVFRYFRNKRFMLAIFVLPIFLVSLSFMLSWLSLIVGNLLNVMIIGQHLESQFPIISHPEKPLLQSVSTTLNEEKSLVILMQPLGISLLLNMFIPKDLQNVNVSLGKKLIRFGIKIGIVIVLALVSFIFINVNIDKWPVVAFIYGALMSFVTPKNFLRFLNKEVEEKEISSEIKNTFFGSKLLLTEVCISWIISVYWFNENISYRLYAFIGIFGILITITIIARISLQARGQDLFSKWTDKKEDKKFKEEKNS